VKAVATLKLLSSFPFESSMGLKSDQLPSAETVPLDGRLTVLRGVGGNRRLGHAILIGVNEGSIGAATAAHRVGRLHDLDTEDGNEARSSFSC